jgi:ribosome-interacting GTPase 1
VRLPTLLLANKCDAIAAVDEELDAFRELSGERFPVLSVSAATGEGLDELGSWLFERLGIVRVYTKAPGHAFEKTRPFTLRRSATVSDVARLVHKDVARTLKYARVWGGHSDFEGQQVGPDHAIVDGDIVELHV